MNKLTVVLSGKKQSGKSSSCNYIRAKYLNLRWQRDISLKRSGYGIDDQHQVWLWVSENRNYFINEIGELHIRSNGHTYAEKDFTLPINHSVKVYSFADPLKDFCINVLGVPYECCWGTDTQKNTPLHHLLWENIPTELRPKFYKEFDGQSGESYEASRFPIIKSGPMTGREIMQIFGTEICRRLYGDCWARGTYSKIKSEAYELSLVADARFPNEISMGNTVQAITVRLGRHVLQDNHASELALDDFPRENYTLYVDNSNLTLQEQCEHMDPYIDKWFKEAGII